MKQLLFFVCALFVCLIFLFCAEDAKNIVASRDHDITAEVLTEPQILSDGISTAQIFATVYDKEGLPARGQKVAFETTYGTITAYQVTDYYGEVIANLRSCASTVDLTAKITATVVDSTFDPMGKNLTSDYTVELKTPGIGSSDEKKFMLNKNQSTQGSIAELYIKFIGISLTTEIEDTVLSADGISSTQITVKLRETSSQAAIPNSLISIGARHGNIVGNTLTNNHGMVEIELTSAEIACYDTLSIEFGNKLSNTLYVQYITPNFVLSANATQIPANGESQIELTATLLSHKNTPIIGAQVDFSSSAGIIRESAFTNDLGRAQVGLISSTIPNSHVVVIASFLTLRDTIVVRFSQTTVDQPQSIILNANPNFIWVKETGNLEQTEITATVLGISGAPVGNDIGVQFSIINAPDGGEIIEPASGSAYQTTVVPTVQGNASAYLRSGSKSGAVQIQARLVEFPDIEAQSTNIIIRSGSPYMWIDPNNPNNVISHTTITIEYGKANLAFGNPVQDIKIGVILGDKYNNPIEEATTVYFTTTGGIITTDAMTDANGRASVTLQNCYPFPFIESNDPNQLTASNIPNPNDSNIPLTVYIPDFEGSVIKNSVSAYDDYGSNDGIAVLLAYTWGRNQSNELKKVWGTSMVVFSTSIHTFTVQADRDTLYIGQSANLNIRLFDINGNPVANGSNLTVSTTAGKLSESSLIASGDQYGYGTTYFSTSLLDNLDPLEDESQQTIITLSLNSPNGVAKRTKSIFLKNQEF